jgi:hypothetical protein
MMVSHWKKRRPKERKLNVIGKARVSEGLIWCRETFHKQAS